MVVHVRTTPTPPQRTAGVPRQLRRGGRDGRAGASATRQYRAMRASWRRRARRRMVVFFAAFTALLVAPAHAWALHTGNWQATYAAGVLLGVALTMFVIVRDSPPPQVAQWELGAWAEKWTAGQLRPLRRRGWTVLHDRLVAPDRRANVDHVVVGPAGTYVLDSKRWRGTIHIDPSTGQITVTNPDDPDLPPTTRHGVDGAALRLSTAVHAHLKRAHSRASWVQAVVVIWGDFPQDHVHVGHVVYVAGDRLRRWLLDQPPRSLRAHPDEVAVALREALPPA